MPRLFERVAIAGVGLIGGSLALAARAAGLVGEVVGCGRSAANLETALQRGMIDRYTNDIAQAVRDADFVLMAVPVRSTADVVRACAPALQRGVVVSDVGSVKSSVIEEVEAVLPPGVAFVGAHPIAGTEASGAAAADAELFHGSRCILTPSASSTPDAVAKLRALWEGVGAVVETMEATRHDEILAWVSHLPHAIAFSVMNALLANDAGAAHYAGPSFRGLTRVAASSAEMWRDIFLTNATSLEHAIRGFSAALEELRQALASGDSEKISKLLEEACGAHSEWRKESAGSAP